MTRELTQMERRVLDRIQQDFPIAADPYGEIARGVGSTREQVRRAVRGLRRRGIIRRIGGSFDAKELGYVSVLVAARVESSRLEEVAARASDYPEVTHNYERDGLYNLWFTLIAEDQARLDQILDDIRRQDGVQAIYALPAVRTFKLKVDFRFGSHDLEALDGGQAE